MSLFDRDKSAERLPISVITGFLGSGKTTLLNALLRRPEMANSAVIINEFGEIGLDHLFVESVDEDIMMMASGCLCCTVRSDLENTLRSLLARRDSGEVPPFERVLVETTGLADPAPVVQLLLNNPMLSHWVRLDAVVTTVDAVNGGRQLDEHAEPVKQAAIADRLLLTKTDLANPCALDALTARLKRLNPAAPIYPVIQGQIDPGVLFGAGLFDPARKTADVRGWLNEAAYAADSEGHHHHDRNRHDARISAVCLTAEAPLDWMNFNGWLRGIRDYRGEDLLRVKGILNLADEPVPVAIHGVHHVFHPPVALERWPDEDRRSRVVFIMRDLNRGELEEGWRALTADRQPA